MYVLNVFSNIPLTDKEVETIIRHLKKLWKNQPNEIWVDKGSDFYNGSINSRFQDNDNEIYSTNNEGKSVVSKRFIRLLKNKICKYMAAISKMCISIIFLKYLMNTKIWL